LGHFLVFNWLEIVGFLCWGCILILLITLTAVSIVVPVPLFSLPVPIVAATVLLFVVAVLLLRVHLFGLLLVVAVVLRSLFPMSAALSATVVVVAVVVVAATTSVALVLAVSSVTTTISILPCLLLFEGFLFNFSLNLRLRFQALFVLVAGLLPVAVFLGEQVLHQQFNSLRRRCALHSNELLKSFEYSIKIVKFLLLSFIAGVFDILLISIAAFVHEVDGAFDRLIVCVESIFIKPKQLFEHFYKRLFLQNLTNI